jgi:hypothetical protein
MQGCKIQEKKGFAVFWSSGAARGSKEDLASKLSCRLFTNGFYGIGIFFILPYCAFIF